MPKFQVKNFLDSDYIIQNMSYTMYMKYKTFTQL